MFIISLPNDLAVGAVFATVEAADATAKRLGLAKYEITEQHTVAERLEYLRGELDAERISTAELVELQGLADHIEPGDVQLLEAAGVPEFPEEDTADSEAKEIVTALMNAAVEDTVNLKRRLKELKLDYEQDDWDLTAAQIKRVNDRLERRIKEAAALAIAVTKF